MRALVSIARLAPLAALVSFSSFGATPTDLYGITAKQINAGKPGEKKEPVAQPLANYRGRVLLVVNTASECGYTKQYKGLQALRAKYRDQGFEVLGFPSNDFGGQEPGTNADIRGFCERQFKVDFPLFEKAPVTGKEIQPVYAYLTEHAPTKGAVAWNFEKFLVGRDGKVVGRYKSAITPESDELDGAVRAALAARPAAEPLLDPKAAPKKK